MKPEYWVLSLSGGKDSTALGLEWLRRHQDDPEKYPLDEVIFCDIGMDFPAMVEHVNKVEQIFKDNEIKFTRVKAEHSFEWYMFEHWPNFRENSKYKNQGYSWPGFNSRWCTKMLKTEVIERYLKPIRETFHVIQLTGLAADEQKRAKRQNNVNHRHPLIEWGWTEEYCLKYCYGHGLYWGGLYEIFHRVSCWCCPLQSLQELRNLRKHFPDLWEKLREMDHKTWRSFLKNYSVDQLEIRFQFEEERLAAGLSIRDRDFFEKLKRRLEDKSDENRF